MVPPVLSVRHSKPKLVVPCKPTPGGKKQLSHIDQQGYLRSQMPMLLFYPAGKETNSNVGRVIKEALGKALVYYYPWAGRMMESDDGNLVVDCTGEGVLFVEAEADITLAEMAGNKGFLAPPFPCVDDLLYDVPEAFDIIDSPLLLFQVSLMFVVNVRPRFDLPDGYYGNAIILAAAVSQAGKVTSSLDHAVELVKRGKEKVTMEFIRSVSLRPGPAPANFQFTDANSWVISDNKPFKFLDIDFGWGKPVYGGPASDLVDEQPIPVSYFINGMDDKGRSGLLVPVCLPDASMDRFVGLVDLTPRPKL